MDQAVAPSSRSTPRALAEHWFTTPVALGVWAALVVGAFAWGRLLASAGQAIALNAPPLFGRFDARVSARILPAAIVAVAAVLYAPGIAVRLSWRRLLFVSAAGALVWAIALALMNGGDGLLGALENPRDYLAALSLVDSPSSFLSGFTDNVASFPVHVEGHPPGMVLWLWGLGALGLSGPWWAAATIIVAGASTTVAALVAVRELADERTARRCAPYLAIAPAAIWIATSADALFMAVGAWGIALFVLATSRRDRRGDVFAGIAGLVLGSALFLSYGIALLGPIVAAIAITRRTLRPIMIAGAGVVVVTGIFAMLGFWWLDGLQATIARYDAGVASHRPFGFFLVNNLAAFSVALGPAIVVALARLRDRRLWLVVGATLAAIVLADLSGLSKGEVERIWLPFVPWVTIAAAVLPSKSRGWLALQAIAALGVATLVRTPW